MTRLCVASGNRHKVGELAELLEAAVPGLEVVGVDAFGEAPAFYKFLRTLEAYRKVLDGTTTLFLPADAEIFGLLQFDVAPGGEPGQPVAEPKPDALAARSSQESTAPEGGRRGSVVIGPPGSGVAKP